MGDGYLVAWRSNEFELAARRVDASGAPAGPLRTIPKGPGSGIPALLRLLPEPGGRVLVTREVEDGGGYGRVMLRRLAADGALLGGPLLVFGGGGAEIGAIDAIRLPDGSVLVAAVSNRSGLDLLLVRRVAPDGTMTAGAVIDERSAYLGEQATRPAFAPAPGGALLAYNAEARIGVRRGVRPPSRRGRRARRRADPADVQRRQRPRHGWRGALAGARLRAVARRVPRGLGVARVVGAAAVRGPGAAARRYGRSGGRAGRGLAGADAARPRRAALRSSPTRRRRPGSSPGSSVARRPRRSPCAPARAAAAVLRARRRAGRGAARRSGGALGPAALAPGALLVWRPSDSTRGRWRGASAVARTQAWRPSTRRLRDTCRPATSICGRARPAPERGFECRLDGGAWGGLPVARAGRRHPPGDGAVGRAGGLGRARRGRGRALADRGRAARDDADGVPVDDGAAREVRLDGLGAVDSECRWDGGAWERCGVSGAERVLAAGPHTFEIRAIDGLGRREASPERWSWTITARTPPHVRPRSRS